MRLDKAQQSTDVEMENSVRICLIALVERAGLKPFIELELGWEAGRVIGGRTGHRLYPGGGSNDGVLSGAAHLGWRIRSKGFWVMEDLHGISVESQTS